MRNTVVTIDFLKQLVVSKKSISSLRGQFLNQEKSAITQKNISESFNKLVDFDLAPRLMWSACKWLNEIKLSARYQIVREKYYGSAITDELIEFSSPGNV